MPKSDGVLGLDDTVSSADGDVLPENLEDHVLSSRLLHEAAVVQGTVTPPDDNLRHHSPVEVNSMSK